MNTQESLTNISIVLPAFRLLMVEDEVIWRDQLMKFLIDFAGSYYDIQFTLAQDAESAMSLLRSAVEQASPYDAVLLDYLLPSITGADPVKSTELGKYCVYQALAGKPPARWIGQITSYSDDPDMVALWPSSDHPIPFRGGLYTKKASDLPLLAKDLFFPEIKEPLASEWLPEELGAVEMPIGRRTSNTPEGFNIYKFIHRMHTVWPALDEPTRGRALELFDIEPNDTLSTKITRIGFRAFSCWDRSTKN
ncbi:hypothetical protein EI77_01724 [Prosthecobacter fusiformis]|uniref:Uncharacterized protein n=1 Tax=Prosthecobacter fusiformis TaxID=48464 RepID=A0A4R7S720_9BACT|nr:hypothetical protein [Prosthecobacter fusiformis]TDU73255.1 hypothetical protein EI77_01724 [Prosthecobacter fusiformis]